MLNAHLAGIVIPITSSQVYTIVEALANLPASTMPELFSPREYVFSIGQTQQFLIK